MTQATRQGSTAASLLRYQLRFSEGREPESLIAVDVADALRQARRRALLVQSPVALWRDGALVAECAVPSDPDGPAIDPDLLERLVAAGFYVCPPPPPYDEEAARRRDGPAP